MNAVRPSRRRRRSAALVLLLGVKTGRGHQRTFRFGKLNKRSDFKLINSGDAPPRVARLDPLNVL